MAPAKTAATKTAETDLVALFSNLEVTADSEPLPAATRSRSSLPNPFTGPVNASVENGTSYSIYVPVDAVARSIFLINAAAKKEDRGVRIVVNNERDDKGALVKGADGKAIPRPEKSGPNKGKVLIRFQGLPERKKTAPRPFTIVNNPAGEGKALKDRATGEIVATGTHDEMRAELKARKQAASSNAAA